MTSDLDALILSLSVSSSAVSRRAVEAIAELRAEVARLNQWADGMTDAAMKERATGEMYQRELRARVEKAEADVTRLTEQLTGANFTIDAQGFELAGERMFIGELQAALLSERKDAERYRWLRAQDDDMATVWVHTIDEDGQPTGDRSLFNWNELDLVIDDHLAKPAIEDTAMKELRKIMLVEDQIKFMVDRFLAWKLPDDFRPDNGISFNPLINEETEHQRKREPSGTNLFDARQAEAMVRHILNQ